MKLRVALALRGPLATALFANLPCFFDGQGPNGQNLAVAVCGADR